MSEPFRTRPLPGQVKQSYWPAIGLALGALLVLSACLPDPSECGNGVIDADEVCDKTAPNSQCAANQGCVECQCVTLCQDKLSSCYGLTAGRPCTYPGEENGPGWCSESGQPAGSGACWCAPCEILWEQCSSGGSCPPGVCEKNSDCSDGVCQGCICVPTYCPLGSDGCWSNTECPSGSVCDPVACNCNSFCGNGVINSGEQCDGMAPNSLCGPQDSCVNCQCVSPSPPEEPPPVAPPPVAPPPLQEAPDGADGSLCGDGIANTAAGEECDGDDLSQCGPEHVCVDCQCVSPSPSEPPPVAPPPLQEAPDGADGSLCGDGICQAGESPDWCGDCTPPDEGGGGDKGGDDEKGDSGDGDQGDGGSFHLPPGSLAICGNGKVEGSEVCDDGGNNGKCGFCNTSCSGVIIC